MIRGRRAAGFTLVEMLVALAVAGLVVAAGRAALAAVEDASARSRAARESALGAVAVRTTLQEWLRSAHAFFAGVNRAEGMIPRDEVVFAVADAGALRPGAHRIRLWIQPEGYGAAHGLLAELTPLSGPAGAAPAETIPLVPAAAGLDVTYRVKLKEGERWVSAWSPESGLPRAIELRIVDRSVVRLGAPETPAVPALLSLPLIVPVGAEAW